uniref:Uncharacterized protein n=1 Tax=Tanacetum cinerariifolium TaxID=118510 RepID=A0A6L2P0A3_TANCI|nr:hypothetical protein [Tanacetum cinerariifolium]
MLKLFEGDDVMRLAANATNLDSIVELIIYVFFLEAHEMAPPPSRSTHLLEEVTRLKLLILLRPILGLLHRLSVSSTPEDLHMYNDMAPDAQVHLSDDKDIGNAYIPKVNLRQDWWKPFEEDRPATPEPAWSIPSSDLPKMMLGQMWIEEECKYDIANMYGISHWWFQRQRLYIDRHTSGGDRRAVRTHIRILSVIRIKVFSMYGYDYMKKIILRRADLNKHIIAERDFNYLYPSDFEDLYLLNLQGHLANELTNAFEKPFELKDLQHSFRNSDACYYDQEKCGHAGPKVTTSQEGNTPQQGWLRDLL